MSFKQLHVVVLNALVPIELDAVVDGCTYYFRSRGRHWYLYRHIVDSVVSLNALMSGVHDDDYTDETIEFGIGRILYYHDLRDTPEFSGKKVP